MKRRYQIAFVSWRFYLILSVIVCAALGLTWRVFDLAILEQPFLRHQGDERVLRLVSTPAFRGMIEDRNGFPLAVSTMVYSCWVNPKEFAPTKANLAALSTLLVVKPSDISLIATNRKNKNREFVYLKRALSPEIAKQIKALNIPGVYLQQEYKRYYPEGEVAAQVIGITNIDDRGQEGLELGYNQWLQGEPGKKWVIKDRLGRVISDVQTVRDEKPGHDLVLSIDRRIQYLAYRVLLDTVTANRAQSGSVIVLDTKTGEVLAMANVPSFNPNNRTGWKSEFLRNRAVTDTFEPGSTMKSFSAVSALDSGKYKPDTMIDTYPGWIRVDHNVVKDHENNGQLTVTQVLQKSSNVGITKMVLGLPPDQLWDLFHRVGFGEITGVGFPGEQEGTIVKHAESFALATLAFGYGISVTTLQLAHAYSVLANGGIKIPLSLLKINQLPVGERVIDAKVSSQMLTMLETVLEKGGTAEAAKVPGYTVAGKTGTAIKVGEKGYEKHRYTSSFVGIAPVSNPRLVVAVVIHDPQGKQYYGGQVSGPAFEKIMEGSLRLLGVPPDDNGG